MRTENIFKIELQKVIAEYSEDTLTITAKEIIVAYCEGFKKMRKNQIEGLIAVTLNTSELKRMNSTVIPFISNQRYKNHKDKPENWTWAFKLEGTKKDLGEKLMDVIKGQKEQAKLLVEDLTEKYSKYLADNKIKKKWSDYAEIQLIKDFVTHIVSWYYSLDILPR